MRPFFQDHFDSWALIPTISVTLGRCECCGQVGGVCISLDWLFGSAGIEIALPGFAGPEH